MQAAPALEVARATAPGGIPPAVSAIRDATRRMDVAAIERLLDEAFAAERFEAATSNVVFPALRAIDEDWATAP